MPESVTPTIEYRLVSENCGTFVIEPLGPGYGITLGNALRRVLLSSLTGAAVSEVMIEGIQHEFSTIPHVKEDTMEFLLNVKGIRLRRLSDRPGKLILEASREGEICAGDIKPSADFEIVNPEHVLATLDSRNAKLNVEFTVNIGKGYLAAGHSEGRPLGMLPVDAVFTPVRRVNYRVQKTRVEDKSNYDQLTLDVWTDGTISPDEAVAECARLLIEQFSIFSKLVQMPDKAITVVEKSPLEPENYDMSLDQLGLSMRTLNALRRGGITNVGILLGKSREELLDLRNFGQKSWEEVQDQLVERNLVERIEAEEVASESGDEPASEDKIAEDAEKEEMRRKLQERFNVREEK
ncbi:MAG: DNA-directed RNA polymerase subunit alpha [Dehalococcoidia bacterium]|nr:DNA-directed RNA polymerase subunit alpha [Dehalococcoidia bacterium]